MSLGLNEFVLSGISLSMGSANERRRYNVTPSPIGRVDTQNDAWLFAGYINTSICFHPSYFFLPHLISEMKNKTDCSLKAFYMTKYFVLLYFMDAVSGLDSSEWKIAYENCNMFDFLIHGNNINSTVLSKWSCIGHIFLLHAQSVMRPSIYKQHSYNNGSVSNHRQLVCLFNTLFWLTTNKTWNLQIKSPAWHAQSVTMIYHCYVLMKDICFLLDRQIQLVMSVSLWAVYMTMSSDKSLIRSPSRLALTAQRALCMPEAQITAAYWITWARQKYLITDGDHFELNIMLLLTSLLWNAYINYYNIHNRVTRHTTQWFSVTEQTSLWWTMLLFLLCRDIGPVRLA